MVGEGFWDKIDELGHLHSTYILWDPLYLTTDAHILKVWSGARCGANSQSSYDIPDGFGYRFPDV